MSRRYGGDEVAAQHSSWHGYFSRSRSVPIYTPYSLYLYAVHMRNVQMHFKRSNTIISPIFAYKRTERGSLQRSYLKCIGTQRTTFRFESLIVSASLCLSVCLSACPCACVFCVVLTWMLWLVHWTKVGKIGPIVRFHRSDAHDKFDVCAKVLFDVRDETGDPISATLYHFTVRPLPVTT